jgi:enoyl-CoA hydratase/carnithine racemase
MATKLLQECTDLLIDRPREGILQISLNRPTRLNALTFDMFDAFATLCADADADPEVRVILLTGNGNGFCAGLDLDLATTLPDMSASDMLDGQTKWANGVTAFHRCSKPVIAAVNGAAAGAGLGLALAADIRIASERARFTAAFVRIGLSGADVGVSWLLPRIVGLGSATEMLLTARTLDATEAHRIGLVSSVVPHDNLLEAAMTMASEIGAHAPFGLRMTKQILHTNIDAPSLEAALELENRGQTLAVADPAMREALTIFRRSRVQADTRTIPSLLNNDERSN